jgi:hypothetical protein
MGYDEEGYQKFLNRGRTNGGSSGYVEAPHVTYTVKKDEMTNAELGTILSGNCNLIQKGRSCQCGGKGHPDRLIAKFRKTMAEHPEFYKKDTTFA